MTTSNDWNARKNFYDGLGFAASGERMEEHGARDYGLHIRLSNLEQFWRHHVAPATNRPDNTFLADNVDPVISRLAERSYEVWCNVVDALDELQCVRKKLVEPRYRSCLNVLRFSGDALQLFGELVFEISGRRLDGKETDRDREPGEKTLAETLEVGIVIFRRGDWKRNWMPCRQKAICYRNMLVHHGRPWLFFKSPNEFEGVPYILRVDPARKTWETWKSQRDLLLQSKEDLENHPNFIALPQACEETLDTTIHWLNEAYGRIVAKLEPLLLEPSYRALWGWA